MQINYNQPINTNVLNGGDYIQFGYQGPLYHDLHLRAHFGVGDDHSSPQLHGSLAYHAAGHYGAFPDHPPAGQQRHSGDPSAVAPLQLPAGTVIDLQASGTNSGFGFGTGAANTPILIFSPTGGVYQVYRTATGASPLIDPVYFLIGRRDRMFTLNLTSNVTIPQTGATGEVVPADGLANWQDPNNLWVSVTPQTGRITTVENAVVAYPTSMTNAAAIVLARGLALQGQSKGGR